MLSTLISIWFLHLAVLLSPGANVLILTNLTNPKSALFFGSVFAASFPPEPSALLQVSAVTLIVVNALFWHLLLAYLFSRERVRAAYSRARNIANRVASAVIGILGLGLLAASWREARL